MKAAVITMASASQRRRSADEPPGAGASWGPAAGAAPGSGGAAAFRSSRTGPFSLPGDAWDVSVLMERNVDGI
ncbi:hypothetical protein GCM10010371_06410 [Streptomyces subrutilus]|uniref:Uncharacterized protein n=1 Tax=Streptomyces subrutilus TaxID=36818 RepID=A0A918V0M7_9ACTN|nr:hypothetical protein GCM10010371_06410 [Streptomyces subrutilus]